MNSKGELVLISAKSYWDVQIIKVTKNLDDFSNSLFISNDPVLYKIDKMLWKLIKINSKTVFFHKVKNFSTDSMFDHYEHTLGYTLTTALQN